MEKLRKVLAIILVTLTALILLFSLGTVIPAIPVFGSVANFATVGFIHLWLPLCLLMFIIALIAAARAEENRWLCRAGAAMSFISVIISVFLLIALVTSLAADGLGISLIPEKGDFTDVVTETFSYSGTEELKVFTCDDGETGKPVMIYIHGGGWIFGSKDDHSYYSCRFAQNGYVTVSIDYGLSSETSHLAGTTEEQIAEAFGWVRDNIGSFGGDVSRLFVTGGSAGGNLALELSYRISSGELAVSSDGQQLPAVRAVSVNFPVCSLEDFYSNSDLILGGTARKMAYAYTGGSPQELPELYRSLDPISHITEDAPPTCIFLGTGDTLVPPGAAYELAAALEENGNTVRVFEIPYGNHMYDMADGGMGSSAYLEGTFRFFEEYM